MKIKFTERYSFEMGKVGMVQVYAYDKGCITEAEDISPNGWARVKNRYCGECFVPPGVFEIVEEPKERTYTEAEVKAIRSEWERLWSDVKDEADTWRKMYTEESARRIEQGRIFRKEIKQISEVSDYNYERYSAANRKLNLLEPEIERIEAAVRRVVPETKEGYLAEQVERVVNELLMIRSALPRAEMNDLSGLPVTFASTEDKHPEDQWAEQEARIKSESLAGRVEEVFEAIGQGAAKALSGLFEAMKRMQELNTAKAAGGQVYRDYIVEWAKEYVEKYRSSVNFYERSENNPRRVTCVMPGFGASQVGRANCHPDNCFNVHIGRAIALMRAQGVSVPPMFFEVPEPTGARVGDKVIVLHPSDEGKVYTIISDTESTIVGDNRIYAEIPKRIGREMKIIDDSREEN